MKSLGALVFAASLFLVTGASPALAKSLSGPAEGLDSQCAGVHGAISSCADRKENPACKALLGNPSFRDTRPSSKCPQMGEVQVCNIAWNQPGPSDGDGVKVGTRFTFLVNSKPVKIAAGPMPGGNCVTVGVFPEGAVVTIHEVIPEGYIVGALARRPSCELDETPVNHHLGAGHILGVTCTVPAGLLDVYFQNELFPSF